MGNWSSAKSGDKSYNVLSESGTHHIHRPDSGLGKVFGTTVGSADSMDKAIDIIKSDSGSKKVDIKKSS